VKWGSVLMCSSQRRVLDGTATDSETKYRISYEALVGDMCYRTPVSI
jgi:hypothetical protein